MDTLRVFDDEWTDLAPRLSMVLAAKGVHVQDRDDLLQETALRLYRVWETLAVDQPVWPFAVTIALNLWRDQLRAAVVRQRDVLSANLADAAADTPTAFDVERTVIARDELAQVGAVIREFAPEQRRLLLDNDEVSASVAPLRPAERMARMRVRRELARMVGRASAALGLLWWRRPVRSSAFATAACAGVLAATVMSGTPFVTAQLPAPRVAAAPVPARSVVVQPVTHRASVHVVHAPAHPIIAAATHHDGLATVPPTSVCAPSGSGKQRTLPIAVSIGSSGVYQDDGTGQQPIIETPPMSTDQAGCVHVG